MRDFEMFNIRQSPFYKPQHYGRYVRGDPQEKVSFYIPKRAYNDLMTYFKGKGMNKTDGFKEILWDRLEHINTSKRTIFNNTELIMLMPKTSNLSELNEKSHIIGLINPDVDFVDGYNYAYGFKKGFNIRYELNDLYEDFFPMEVLQNTKYSCLFGIETGDLINWDSLYDRLAEKYDDLDLEKSYFVRFPLNNYLDVNRDGQFQHLRREGFHRGIYLFHHLDHHTFYMVMDWEYAPFGDILGFGAKFIPQIEFASMVKDADYKPLRDYYKHFEDENYIKEVMENGLREAEELREFAERQIAFYKKHL